MKIIYKPGKSHRNADAKSRWINFIKLETIIEEQQKQDKELMSLKDKLVSKYSVINGKLMWDVDKVVVPKQLRSLVLYEAHDGLLGAHLGIKRTISKIARKYFWPNMQKDIEDYCNACSVCQEAKGPRKLTRQQLKPTPVNGVFERIAMDILGPLPMTMKGNKDIY